MDQAQVKECTRLDKAFRSTGTTACAGIITYRRRFFGLSAYLGLLDDPIGYCSRGFGYWSFLAVFHDPHQKP